MTEDKEEVDLEQSLIIKFSTDRKTQEIYTHITCDDPSFNEKTQKEFDQLPEDRQRLMAIVAKLGSMIEPLVYAVLERLGAEDRTGLIPKTKKEITLQ